MKLPQELPLGPDDFVNRQHYMAVSFLSATVYTQHMRYLKCFGMSSSRENGTKGKRKLQADRRENTKKKDLLGV